MVRAVGSNQDVEFDPQEVATPSNIAWAERERKAERDSLLHLLTEYTARVDELSKALDQARRQSAFTIMWFPLALLVGFFVVAWLSNLIPNNEFIVISIVVTSIGLLLALLPTYRVYVDQRRKLRILQRDLRIAARQLTRVVEVASSVEQNALVRSVERLEFNLRLTDAEEKLRYIGSID